MLFSKSTSVESLIDCGVSNYLEFNNVTENYFYNPPSSNENTLESLQQQLCEHMVKLPFSKSEIFVSTVLTFKEKRQLVKAIEMCLEGTDKMKEMEE